MTEEYTKIQLTRQEELTRLIQERLASVGEKQTTEARSGVAWSPMMTDCERPGRVFHAANNAGFEEPASFHPTRPRSRGQPAMK